MLTDTETMVLQRCRLFVDLGQGQLRVVAERCRRRLVDAGQTVLFEGEPGRSMLIVVFGAVEYRRGARVVGRDGSGAFFGELALLGAGPVRRAVSVVAVEDCVLLELYREDFDALVLLFPAVGLVAMRVMSDRLRVADPAPLFRSWSSAAIVVGVLAVAATNLLLWLLPDGNVIDGVRDVAQTAMRIVGPVCGAAGLVLRHIEIRSVRKRIFGA